MAKATSTTPVEGATPKVRKPARTIEQQIEDLRAKAAAKAAKVDSKTTKALEAVNAKILVAETKLAALYLARDELTGETTFSGEPVDEPAEFISVTAPQS